MGDATKDKRFAHISSDPKFKIIPRSKRRVKIDKRFQSMFKDKNFKVRFTVDKRGRPTSGTSNEDLQRFYALSSSESSDSEAEEQNKHSVILEEESSEHNAHGSSDEDERNAQRSDDEELSDKVKLKLRDLSVDYARGEGEILSDSSSDEDTSDNDEEDVISHEWGELDRGAERTDTITRRLAVCNMDWDRIRAIDLMVLFSSFTPPGGLVRSVTIYPSQFGLERMKKEEEEGPQELIKRKTESSIKDEDSDLISDEEEKDDIKNMDMNANDEAEEGSTYEMEKLRRYQLNRLKYYYAVVECDSPSTANHIYDECDGMEYESSATRLDLRFVPEETMFEENPRESCAEIPDSKNYQPRNFTTTALQQGKVDLTWDETDPSRAELTDRLMSGNSVDDADLRAYLASSSSEDENNDTQQTRVSKNQDERNPSVPFTNNINEEVSENSISDEDDSISKYRSLLAGINEDHSKDKDDIHMEISWDIGLKEKTEEAVKKHISASNELTPFQQMMEKRREKRKEKRKMKEKLTSDEIGKDSNAFSDDEVPSDVDLNDPYFADEHQSSSKARKRRSKELSGNDDDSTKKAELELLLMDESNSKHFNFKKIQSEEDEQVSGKKRKKMKKMKKKSASNMTVEDNFKVDVDDNRFSSLFSSHLFNIDPTDPHFKRSRGMDELIAAKQKRLVQRPDDGNTSCSELASKSLKKDGELSALVKSIKYKSKNFRKE